MCDQTHRSAKSRPKVDSSMHFRKSRERGPRKSIGWQTPALVSGNAQWIRHALDTHLTTSFELVASSLSVTKWPATRAQRTFVERRRLGRRVRETMSTSHEIRSEMSTEWPSELLPASDVHQCTLAQLYDSAVMRNNESTHTHLMWLPKRANNGCDAGIVALAPSAGRAGCWPSNVPRASTTPPVPGFYIAACAPSNANEIRRERSSVPGLRGSVCSRSHQIFMNTTRKCTGTYRPNVRQSCSNHDRQNL